jgi:2-amino-4-hydroxy-6-hydroxymethyldihydropteridine diphosphokinase
MESDMQEKQKTHKAYLSIGSNIGDKAKNLKDTLEILQQHEHMDLLSVSPFYKTEPQNYKDQAWFVNAAAKVSTDLSPERLLAELKHIEKALDKNGKAFRFGPRIIDLDIIYYEDLVYTSSELEIPHPRMHERCFVLVPLCDIASDEIHPVLNVRSDELLKKIESREAQKVIPQKES